MTDLQITLGSVRFRNPVFSASGTFGYGIENPELTARQDLGALITKSITLQPRAGNPPPRLVETPSGLINSIGLANIGVDCFIREMLPGYPQLNTSILVNIAGSTQDEYAEVLHKIESVSSDIAGYEINISCPNVTAGGMEFGISPQLTARLTGRLRKLTQRLLIMKLSPNVTDITQIGTAAEEHGADAVSAINTLAGLSVDPKTWKSNIYKTFGGLSGPAIKPVGLACVHKLYRGLKIPVLGVGGIVSAGDAVEYALAGATAIQVGTANFRDPTICREIIAGLQKYCEEHNLSRFSKLTGQMKTWS